MTKPKLLNVVPMTNAPHKLIASALRTLEAEASGISALTAAMQNGLGDSFTAAVNLISNDPASPETLLLKGTATAVNLSLTSLTFAPQTVGTASSPLHFTLTNSSLVPLAMGAFTMTGDFSQSNTCGSSLAAGANCTVSIVFTPTATGGRTGTITIADSDYQSPQLVTLVGTGN